MRLFSYCIPVDDGAAPNPYWGICTLTICKPVIRRTAEVGDWIIGVGSKRMKRSKGGSYEKRLVYAMKVTEIMSLEEYDKFCTRKLSKKIPDLESKDYRRQVGDCQYDYSDEYASQRPGVHSRKNRAKDLRGENSLLSKHFYYFGNKAEKIPFRFWELCRQGQGHQLQKNDKVKEAFVKWLTNKFEKNKLYGEPQIKLDFSKRGNSKYCSIKRCEEADQDEKIYKKGKSHLSIKVLNRN